MMINRLSGVSPIQNTQPTSRASKTENVKSSPDSISISDEAKEMARAYFMHQVAEETPDVREDLVAQIKEKIKDPNYLNNAILGSTADKIMASYGL